MLHNYKSFTLILESSAREKKIEKVKAKIKKFANFPGIYNWSIDKCINDRSTDGLQFAVWIANHLKDVVIDGLLSTLVVDYGRLVNEERLKKYIASGEESDKELGAMITEEWNNINDVIEGFQEAIDEETNYILDWLKNPLRTELVNLSDLTFKEAHKKSEEWHNSLKATGKITDESGEIFIEFEDGFYWIDLQTTYSKEESEAMGHCGNTNDGDTLFSLRDKDKSPHVTVAYDSKDGCIYQMKGRQNKKPVEKYYSYIYRLLVDPELKPQYFGYEWNKEEDFNLSDFDKETFDKVYKFNPKLIYKSIENDKNMAKGLINKEYLGKEEMKDIIKNCNSFDVFLNTFEDDLFSKEEQKELFENNFDIAILNNYGELPVIMLYNRGIINIEQLSKKYSEIEIVDGVAYLDMDDSDMENFTSDGVHNILCGEDWFEPGDSFDMNSASDIWDDLTKENKEKIIEKMVGSTISYTHFRGGEKFYDVEVTKDMFIWDGKDYMFVYNNEEYKIENVLDENKDDELTDLYDALSRSNSNAQDSANQDEYYKQAKKSVVNLLAEYKKIDIKIGDKYREYFRFNLSEVFNFSYAEEMLKNMYSWHGEINYEEESYGSLIHILREIKDNELADINDNYGLYGDIDKDVLNDYVSEDLRNI